jgi:hypothetical protein
MPLRSPLQQKDCVHYALEIQEYRRKGKSSRWVTLFEQQVTAPFFLFDETGYVGVDFGTAEKSLGRPTTFRWSALSEMQQQQLLEHARKTDPGFSDRGLIFKKTLRVKEVVIEVGSPFYAHGTLTKSLSDSEVRPMQGYQFFLRKIRALKADPAKARRQLDRNRDGRVSSEEWREAYRSEARAVGASTEGGRPLVIPKNMPVTLDCFGRMVRGDSHPLFVADCHQEELIRRISRWNFLILAGGAALIAIGVATIYAKITGRNI